MCALVSWEEFSNAVTSQDGFKYMPPRRDQYEAFVSGLQKDGDITDKVEAAMLLAQIIHESGGLRLLHETGKPKRYENSVGIPGQKYYGRGYIQLTGSENYKAASKHIYKDDTLLRYPDKVADDEDCAWKTTFWFWKFNVHNREGMKSRQFGDTTRAINSTECTNSDSNYLAVRRFEIYKKVLIAFNLDVEPNESGCY